MIEMYDKRCEIRYSPRGNSITREIEAIRDNEFDTRLKNKHDIDVCCSKKLLKVLKKILLKITKTS